MGLKEFFKPTKGKIIAFVIILVLGFLQFYFSQYMMIGGAGATGFPFEFGWLSGCATPGPNETVCWDTEIISWPALIVNIIVFLLPILNKY